MNVFTVKSIMPAALEGSDVHSTHLTTNIYERCRDTHVQHNAHAHTLGKETEREAVSSVPWHAEIVCLQRFSTWCPALLLSTLLRFSLLNDRVWFV